MQYKERKIIQTRKNKKDFYPSPIRDRVVARLFFYLPRRILVYTTLNYLGNLLRNDKSDSGKSSGKNATIRCYENGKGRSISIIMQTQIMICRR